jgi:pyruvate-formate lyase-activating enzyme
MNTDYEKARRLEMLQGIRHSDCKNCWKIEDSGGTSMRLRDGQGFEEYFRDELIQEFGTTDLGIISKLVTIDSKILTVDTPRRLEFTLENLCDMKCMYCSRSYSSQWALHDLQKNIITQDQYNYCTSTVTNNLFTTKTSEWFDSLDKDKLKFIGFIGGEPSINPEFYNQIDMLLEKYSKIKDKSTRVWIVTNLNTKSQQFDKFLLYLKKLAETFKLQLTVSIEALYKQAEFIRTNLVWERFESNFHKLLVSIPDIEITINPAINALSIPRFKEFLEWHNSLASRYGITIHLSPSIVAYPEHLYPFILPPYFASYVTTALEYATQNNYPKLYVDLIASLKIGIENNSTIDPVILKKWYENVNILAEEKKINFLEVFPEFSNLYNYCKDL